MRRILFQLTVSLKLSIISLRTLQLVRSKEDIWIGKHLRQEFSVSLLDLDILTQEDY